MAGLAKGDLGYSESNHAPIAALIADRAPETLREIAIGLGGRMVLRTGSGDPETWFLNHRGPAAQPAHRADRVSVSGGGCEICFGLRDRADAEDFPLRPQSSGTGLLGSACRDGASPRRERTEDPGGSRSARYLPAITSTCSRIGEHGDRRGDSHRSDLRRPGLGRLAWNAAMARDLPLLVNLTMLIAVATTIATAVSEMAHD